MKLFFHGDREEFEWFVTNMQIVGVVKQMPNGVYRVCCIDGSNMSWSSTTKRVWFDGDQAACRKLEDNARDILIHDYPIQFDYAR